MHMTKRTNRTLIPFLLLPILVLLIIGSIMLFRFYQNQNYTKIQRERRSLDTLVIQIYYREYQRIFLITHALGQANADSEDTLRNNLLSLQDLFSPTGQIPGIVKKIGYRQAKDGDMIQILGSDQEWTPISYPLTDLPSKGIVLFNIKDESTGLPRIFLISIPEKQDEFMIQLELDWSLFFKLYIKPALEQSLNSYELKWDTRQEKENDAPAFRGPEMERYRFHPFSALLKRHYGEGIDHKALLPFPFFSGDPVVINEKPPTGENKRGPRENLFPLIERESIRDAGASLYIGYENAPFYKGIERENAASWLQSMMVLFGMGGIFLIMVAQLARLRDVREKEKEFVASMTHELRTPLTVIQSAADNMVQGIIPAERMNQYGVLIRNQVLRLGTMVEEILLFSSMEGTPVLSDPVRVDLYAIIEEIKSGAAPIAEQQGLSLHWDTEGLLPVSLRDPEIFKLGLNNLLMNALYHAYPQTAGPVRILIHSGIPDSLQIILEDEGRGIPTGEQKKVFAPFYRDRFSRENQEKGSGLGLFICHKKVTAAGGSLKLESPYKKLNGTRQTGCRFTLRLPCRISREDGNL